MLLWLASFLLIVPRSALPLPGIEVDLTDSASCLLTVSSGEQSCTLAPSATGFDCCKYNLVEGVCEPSNECDSVSGTTGETPGQTPGPTVSPTPGPTAGRLVDDPVAIPGSEVNIMGDDGSPGDATILNDSVECILTVSSGENVCTLAPSVVEYDCCMYNTFAGICEPSNNCGLVPGTEINLDGDGSAASANVLNDSSECLLSVSGGQNVCSRSPSATGFECCQYDLASGTCEPQTACDPTASPTLNPTRAPTAPPTVSPTADFCSPNPCQNDGVCTANSNGYTCSCPSGFQGINCETNVDDCNPNPCNGGTCIDRVNGYTCTNCPEGFEGTQCEVRSPTASPTTSPTPKPTPSPTPVPTPDYCSPNPCQNGGLCSQDSVHGYICACPSGFQGRDCETNTDDCDPNPCANGGTCVDRVNGYTCNCPEGFEGSQCETNSDDCAPNPCFNGGTCVDGINGYTCNCVQGFEGSQCETNTDDCSPNPCFNGGTCVDGVNGYTCNCPEGYEGSDCEVEPPTPAPTKGKGKGSKRGRVLRPTKRSGLRRRGRRADV